MTNRHRLLILYHMTERTMQRVLHIRIPDDLGEWLDEHMPSRGEKSWLVRELLAAYRVEYAARPALSEVVQKAVERVG